ncbi:hypothetical protein F5B17DRAFT_428110 [Nemania serpens]|nr:hypothetical protein F5B17DRAFT_428110 [Nemania serpens]
MLPSMCQALADTFVVCMETITAVFWGPPLLLVRVVHCILAEHPLRHPLQSIVSLRRRNYATCAFDFASSGIEYSAGDA